MHSTGKNQYARIAAFVLGVDLKPKESILMNSRRLLRLSLLLMLAMSAAACGGPTEPTPYPDEAAAVPTAEPSPVPTELPLPTSNLKPTNSPEPTSSPGPEREPTQEKMELDTVLAPVSYLSSYRSSMTIQVEGIDNDQEIRGTIEYLVEYKRDPLAQHIAISSQGFENGAESIRTELYRVGDTSYMQFGEEWLAMSAAGEDPLDDAGIVAPDDMLDDTCGWKQQMGTEYNSMPVYHWTLEAGDLAECMTADQSAQMGEITDASGNLYVAVDGNYIVHMDLIFQGQELAVGVGSAEDRVEEGRVEFTFEMTDVNQPFAIQVPEEALATSAMPEDIPIPDDAEEVNNMFGMVTFLSPRTPQQVVERFRAEMPELGWREVSVDEFGGTFVLEYSKVERTASLMISIDQDSNRTSVLITVEGD